MSLTNEQESLHDGAQKIWTQPVFVKTAQDLISRMDDKRSKVFNAHQGKFGSQWLNVDPCKGKWSLGLMPFGLKSFSLIQLVTWLNFFKLSVSGIGHLA